MVRSPLHVRVSQVFKAAMSQRQLPREDATQPRTTQDADPTCKLSYRLKPSAQLSSGPFSRTHSDPQLAAPLHPTPPHPLPLAPGGNPPSGSPGLDPSHLGWWVRETRPRELLGNLLSPLREEPCSQGAGAPAPPRGFQLFQLGSSTPQCVGLNKYETQTPTTLRPEPGMAGGWHSFFPAVLGYTSPLHSGSLREG